MEFSGIIEIGSIFSIFLLGMIFSFRFLGFTDLTIEGSFVIGGAIYAISNSFCLNPLLSLFFSILGGCFSGLVTALLHCYVGINKLLSGIITLTILYSINMRIMGLNNIDSQSGRSNLAIKNIDLLNFYDAPWFEPILLLSLSLIVFIIIRWLLSTNFGLYVRATGGNELFVRRLNQNPKRIIIIGLIIANGIIALSGCLFAQTIGASDINQGQGMLVLMLTALIIGENLIRPYSINRQLLSAFAGAFLFDIIYSFAIDEKGIDPIDLKLMIGSLFILFIILTKLTQRGRVNKSIGCDFF
jgi:putative tryptophan/tyrosine transport system permease protein